MNTTIKSTILIIIVALFASCTEPGGNVFQVIDGKTCLNDQPILVKGLRCSNALMSDQTTQDLIDNLEVYKSYGLNTVSVFIMGSRFGDVIGFNKDATLNTGYTPRLTRIIEAADEHGMVVLVGCLYWSISKAKWEEWTQEEANQAVFNTVKWLTDNNYRNVFVDVDNEGMAMRGAGFDPQQLVQWGKKAYPNMMIATNFKGLPPAEADLGIHFSKVDESKPYIESEGTPDNAPGYYWADYSKVKGLYNYINIGVYNDSMKTRQLEVTKQHFDKGHGYMLASTWLQCVAPYGPNSHPGGYGSDDDPGILWWLEAVKEWYGPYVAPGK